MPTVWNGGQIDLSYMDRDVFELTFRVHSRIRLSASLLLNALVGLVREEDVVEMGRTDGLSWNVTVGNVDAGRILQQAGILTINGQNCRLVCVSQQVVEVRCHWLPSYIKDDFLKVLFERYGKVLAVRRETTVIGPNTEKRNGVRVVVIQTDDLMKGNIPHLMRFQDGISILITMPGRPPLCLKCHEVGHVRRDCMNGMPPPRQPRSYAQVAREPREMEKRQPVEKLDEHDGGVDGVKDDVTEKREERKVDTDEPFFEESEESEADIIIDPAQLEIVEETPVQKEDTFRPWTDDNIDSITCGQLQIVTEPDVAMTENDDSFLQDAFETVVRGPKKARKK